jgi:hypothetical protein
VEGYNQGLVGRPFQPLHNDSTLGSGVFANPSKRDICFLGLSRDIWTIYARHTGNMRLDQINGTIDAFDGAAVRTVSWAKAVPIPTSAMIILHVFLPWSPRSRNAVQFMIDP